MQRFWENGSGHAGECPHVRKMLKLLSVELSLDLLEQLADAAKDVSAIAQALELDAPAISRHLKQLHSFSIVEVKRSKQHHVYSLGAGVEVSAEGEFLHVKTRTADGGEIAISLPRSGRFGRNLD